MVSEIQAALTYGFAIPWEMLWLAWSKMAPTTPTFQAVRRRKGKWRLTPQLFLSIGELRNEVLALVSNFFCLL